MEHMTTKTKTKKKRKTRATHETLEQRVAALEEALEAIKDEQAAALASELDTIPVSAPAPAIPEPVIPLGYERVGTAEEADEGGDGKVLAMWYHRIIEKWVERGYYRAKPHPIIVYLRCILPPDIESHWQPAPGVTHEAQRKGAWQMGGGPGYNRKFACWAPYTTEVVTCLVSEFERNLNWVPVVPKAKP